MFWLAIDELGRLPALNHGTGSSSLVEARIKNRARKWATAEMFEEGTAAS